MFYTYKQLDCALGSEFISEIRPNGPELRPDTYLPSPSQVNTLLKAKSETRSKQNKDMHKYSSVYSERGVPLLVLTSGGE